MLTTIHPFFIIAGVCLVGVLVFGFLAFRASTVLRRRVFDLLTLVCIAPAGLLLVVFHPEWVDARFRTYKAFYREIHEGMTRPELDALLARFYPASGSRLPPKIMDDMPERLGFFMNPETSTEPNCEGIFLSLRDGRITEKQYSRD